MYRHKQRHYRHNGDASHNRVSVQLYLVAIIGVDFSEKVEGPNPHAFPSLFLYGSLSKSGSGLELRTLKIAVLSLVSAHVV